MGKWADLPLDLMKCVDEYLDFVEKVLVRATCTSWHSYLPVVPKLISEQLPLLLLEDSTKGASLYSVHEGKQYPLNLPELKHKIFKGSAHGWVITLEDDDSSDIDEIYAFNPLTRVRIKFPPRSAFPDVKDYNPQRVGQEYILKEAVQEEPVLRETENEPLRVQNDRPVYYIGKRCANHYHLPKVVLSSSPSSNDCVAVAIYGEFRQLAWCRPHNKEWTSFVEFRGKKGPQTAIWDVTFHNGKLYVLYSRKKLEIYDSIDPNVVLRRVVTSHMEDEPSLMFTPAYLAICPNLGIIVASQEIHTYQKDGVHIVDTGYFNLFRLDESTKTWVEVEGLGENVLFLGLNMQPLVPISDKFKALGYRRNCVYFTDNEAFESGKEEKQEDSDMGIYNIDDSFTDVLPGLNDEPICIWPPPIWVTPSAN